MRSTRKLAAIMFTDIAGYTALMQQSERTAIDTRRRHREVFEPTTEKHGGRIIQYYGDGTLSIFDSTVSAVRCAHELQQQFLSEPSIPVRIGIHTGDIILSDTDIIGDSVNLASRIESLGVPGSVLVSGKVAEEIKNQDDLPLYYLGAFHFKNDYRPRDAYALDLPGLVIPQKKELQGKLKKPKQKSWIARNRQKSIPILSLLVIIAIWRIFIMSTGPEYERLAVLPFDNRMNDPEQMYVVDGVHQALISELQQIGIQVKGQPTMMRYKDEDVALEQVVEELDIEALVDGYIFRADDTLGLNISLIDGESGDLVWGDTYEAALKDVLVLYRDVTRDIAIKIRQELTPRARDRLNRTEEVDPRAIKAYWNGQQNWNKLTAEGLTLALDYFKLALQHDPNYAPAYAGIAGVWTGRLQQGMVSHAEVLPVLVDAISKAMELNAELAEVQFWRATANTWVLNDWETADRAFQKSLEINPGAAETHAYYAHYLYIMNRPEEGRAHMEEALKIDPFNPLLQSLNGMTLNFDRQYEPVIDMLTNTLANDPTAPVAISTLRTTYHLAGRYEKALDIWEKYYLIRQDTFAIAVLKDGYAEGGYHFALQSLAEMMVGRSEAGYVTPWQIATLYTRAEKPQEALDWLEKAYKMHDNNMPYISIDPIFDYMRDEPRFRALLGKMNLPGG